MGSFQTPVNLNSDMYLGEKKAIETVEMWIDWMNPCVDHI